MLLERALDFTERAGILGGAQERGGGELEGACEERIERPGAYSGQVY